MQVRTRRSAAVPLAGALLGLSLVLGTGSVAADSTQIVSNLNQSAHTVIPAGAVRDDSATDPLPAPAPETGGDSGDSSGG